MSELTTNDVKKAFNEWRESPSDYENMDWWDWYANADCEGYGSIEVPGLGRLDVVEACLGNRSGELVDRESLPSGGVWKENIVFTIGDQTFRIWGEWDSWDSQGWDGEVEEVEQVEKLITVWEKKIDY